jgi:hypothetical protein
MLDLLFDPEDGGDTGLHGVIFHNTYRKGVKLSFLTDRGSP